MDVFQLLDRLPPAILLAPLFRRTSQPHREGFRKILFRMSLRIPVRKMLHEALAIGARSVCFRSVLSLGAAENVLPVLTRGKLIRMVHGMAAFMPKKHLAPLG